VYASFNGASGVLLDFHGDSDNNWNRVQEMQVSVRLNAGNNTIKFFDDSGASPDLDRITV
jgi:hypothetical protein